MKGWTLARVIALTALVASSLNHIAYAEHDEPGLSENSWGMLDREKGDCIATPNEFWDHMSEIAGTHKVPRCVDRNLYGRIGAPSDKEFMRTRRELGQREENFAAGYLGLQAYLQMSSLYLDRSCEGSLKFIQAMKTFVGFQTNTAVDAFRDPSESWGNISDVGVFKLPKDFPTKPEVPTPAFWFSFMADEDASNVTDGLVPAHVQRDINFAYGTANPRPADTFVDVYTDLTGCQLPLRTRLQWGADYFPTPSLDGFADADALRSFLNESNCGEDYINAALAALEVTIPTDKCLDTYFKAVPYAERTAAGVRAIMDICLDSSSLNAASGMTWNTISSPFSCKPLRKQSNKERFFGPELVLPGIPIDNVLGGVPEEDIVIQPIDLIRYDTKVPLMFLPNTSFFTNALFLFHCLALLNPQECSSQLTAPAMRPLWEKKLPLVLVGTVTRG